MEKLPDALLKASILKCKSDIENAKAKICLYLTVPTGVGEHPDLVSEILNAAEEGAAAQEKLDFLQEVSPRAAFFNSK